MIGDGNTTENIVIPSAFISYESGNYILEELDRWNTTPPVLVTLNSTGQRT
jgi:hypothetical protein